MGIENVEKFLMAMDQMELPRFQVDDLEKVKLLSVVSYTNIVLSNMIEKQFHRVNCFFIYTEIKHPNICNIKILNMISIG